MSREIVIRSAAKQDAPLIKQLLDELENYISDPQIFEVIFENYLTQEDTLLYVAENSTGDVIAFASCKGQYLLHHQGMVFEIQEMIVTRAEQGNGIGRALIDVIRKEVAVRGAKSLEVTSNKRRKEAHAFYQSVGFRNSHEKFTIYF
jgi:PhnO protein